jgi:hypothetical protein
MSISDEVERVFFHCFIHTAPDPIEIGDKT